MNRSSGRRCASAQVYGSAGGEARAGRKAAAFCGGSHAGYRQPLVEELDPTLLQPAPRNGCFCIPCLKPAMLRFRLSAVSPLVGEALKVPASSERLSALLKELGLGRRDLLDLVRVFKRPRH